MHQHGRVAYVAACWRCNNIRSKVTARPSAKGKRFREQSAT